jgi:hypothetical protein
MTVKRAVGAVLSRGASWIQGRDGGGEVEIARLSSMKSRSFLQKWEKLHMRILNSMPESDLHVPYQLMDPDPNYEVPGILFTFLIGYS